VTDWENDSADVRAEEIAIECDKRACAEMRGPVRCLWNDAARIARSTIKKPEPKTREQEANEAHAWLDEHLAGHPPGPDRSIVERFYGYVKLIDLHANALAQLYASQREQVLEDALRKLRDECALGSYGRGLAERALEWKP